MQRKSFPFAALLAAWGVTCALSPPAWARRSDPRETEPVFTSRVSYATTEGAYVSHGAADGLRVGDTLKSQTGEPFCRIVRIADHSALCATKKARHGQNLVLPRPPKSRKVEPKTSKPIRITRAMKVRRIRRFRATPFALVPFDGQSAPSHGFSRRNVAGRYRISHPVWSTQSRVFQSETVTMDVRGNDLGIAGLRVDASLAARQWTKRPEDVRFRPAAKTQLDVWQVRVSYREPTKRLTASAGRMRPRFVPGVSLIDGAQVGYRIRGRNEVGVFGGMLPDLTTTDLRTDSWIAGGYGVYELPIGKSLMLRTQGRLSLANVVDAQRMGAEVDSRLRVSRYIHVGGAVSAQAGSGKTIIDRGSVDASAEISRRVRVHGGARYLDARRGIIWGSPYSLPHTITRRADLGVQTTITRHVRFDLSGGQLDEVGTPAKRQYVGPTLHLPGVLPRHTGFSVGYIEELGTNPAHVGFFSVNTRPLERLSIAARFGTAIAPLDTTNNQSFGALQTDYRIFDVLTASLSVTAYQGRIDLTPGSTLDPIAGFAGQLSILGSF